MAGAGTRLFVDGQILTAAQVNTYLQDQVIMRFANAATRDAAFGGVGEPTLAEGMFCYLDDTNVLQSYNGSAWVNVVSSITPPALELISTSTFTNSTGFDITGFTSSYGYFRLLLAMRRTDTVGGTTVYAQLYNGTTPRATAYYASAFFTSYLGTTGVGYTTNNGSNFFLFNADSGVTDGSGFGSFDISGMTSATFAMNGVFWDVQNARHYTLGAYRNVADTNDRLKVSITTGQVSGNWKLYGYRNS